MPPLALMGFDLLDPRNLGGCAANLWRPRRSKLRMLVAGLLATFKVDTLQCGQPRTMSEGLLLIPCVLFERLMCCKCWATRTQCKQGPRRCPAAKQKQQKMGCKLLGKATLKVDVLQIRAAYRLMPKVSSSCFAQYRSESSSSMRSPTLTRSACSWCCISCNFVCNCCSCPLPPPPV